MFFSEGLKIPSVVGAIAETGRVTQAWPGNAAKQLLADPDRAAVPKKPRRVFVSESWCRSVQKVPPRHSASYRRPLPNGLFGVDGW